MAQLLRKKKNNLVFEKETFEKEFEKIKSKETTALYEPKIPKKYKSVLQGLSIQEKNEKFETLSKCQQIREVALDALTLLMTNKNINAAYGEYWSLKLHQLFDKAILGNSKEIGSKKLQEKLNEKIPQCQVCERGLWMISQIRMSGYKSNDWTSSEVCERGGWYEEDGALKALSFDNFREMENEFERSWYNQPYNSNSKEKLANIMCNVIANCGFDTKDKKDYLRSWNIKLA